MSHYDDLGGEARLKAIFRDFYRRVFADPMIGYLFVGQDPARLVELEFQLTAKMFGAPVAYTGRSMRAAHAKHSIRKGHFHRRNQILLDTLRDHDVPPAIMDAWMGHARALERAVVAPRDRADRGCDADLPPRVDEVREYP